MPKFRKKPVDVEAFRFGIDKPYLWWKTAVDDGKARVVTPVPCDGPQYVSIAARMYADRGDWIVRDVNGELYSCKPDIFAATYEPA